MRDVKALYALWQFRQHKCVGKRFLNGLARGLKNAETLCVRLPGVLSGQIDKRAFFAALWHRNFNATANALTEQVSERIAIVDRGELLALDTPDRLKARAPGGTLIELSLDGDATAAVDRVRAVAGVSSAAAEHETLRVYSDRGGELIPALIHEAGLAARSVRDIHLSPPSLETLFIALTGRKLD